MSNMSKAQLEEARISWLQGKSLRQLAPKYSMSHGQLHTLLRKEYGVTVCDRKANSLRRSLIRDGESTEIVMQLPLVDEWVNGFKQDNVYSRSRMLDFSRAWEIVWDEPEEEPKCLLLPWYLFILDTVLVLLDKVEAH